MTKYPCPKCGSNHSWFEEDGDALVHRCVCGLTKYLFREMVDGTTIMSSGVPVPDITLPAEGTKIRLCLTAVRNAHPRHIKTGEIVTETGLRGKETASLVVTLMGRGLLERVKARRGLLGGSIWKLTVTAKKLLKVDNEVDEYGASIGYAGGEELLFGGYPSGGEQDIYTDQDVVDYSWVHCEESDDWS